MVHRVTRKLFPQGQCPPSQPENCHQSPVTVGSSKKETRDEQWCRISALPARKRSPFPTSRKTSLHV